MFDKCLKSTVLSVFMAGALVSCSDTQNRETRNSARKDAREFSAEDKRIARSLSIGNNTAADKYESAYRQAMFCSFAVGDLVNRLNELGSVNDDVKQAGNRAKVIFDRRLRRLVEQEGIADDMLRRDLDQIRNDNEDAGANARAALACLQTLQSRSEVR